MWIGWASSVKLWISQTSVAPNAGFSVMGWSHPRMTGFPASSRVPSSASLGPTPSRTAESSSFRETRRVAVASPSGVNEGSVSWEGGTLASVDARGTTTSFITWPVVAGSAASKSTPGFPPPNGSSGASLMRNSSVPTGTPVGTELFLINEAPDEPFGGGKPGVDFEAADPATTGQVMKLVVVPLASTDASV